MPAGVSCHVARVKALYRKILQLHRRLPLEMKTLGDQYVKEEFRRHKSVDRKEAQCFLQEWESYATVLGQQTNTANSNSGPHFGSHIPDEKLNALRDEQIGQLLELMQEATKPKRQFNVLDDPKFKS